MPFPRPTLSALRNQAIEDVTSSGVPGLDGLLRNAVLRVLAWVTAGLAYSVYGYHDWIAKQSVPFTATDEFLQGWAALIGIYQKDATPATGQATFNGSPNIYLASGVALTRQDATPYTTTTGGTTDAYGNVTVGIVAAVDGAATNCDAGTPIAIDTPIAGLNSSGTVVAAVAGSNAGCTGGADQELEDALRTRMLAKYRAPPQGGSAADYQQWAMAVPGVSRAWVQPFGMGPGSVIVRPMFDDANAADGGFPQGTDGVASGETRGTVATGDQLTVANYIWTLQPVTALVYVAAPVAHPIDVVLVDLDPDDPDLEAEIVAAIDDMYLPKATIGGTIWPSDIYEAILATPGINHFTMTQPALPITVAAGELPIMGTLTVENA
jgi:uncharacterized phage protein gp47/JayE